MFLAEGKLTEEDHFQDIETSLQEVKPEYVVIANETSEHHPALKMVLSYEVPKILVENLYFRPQLDVFQNSHSQVRVAYNLRFHPLLQHLYSEIKGQTVLSVQIYVGQYLPDWRPKQVYQNSYSVSKAQGWSAKRFES